MWSVIDVVVCDNEVVDLYIIDAVFRKLTKKPFTIYRQRSYKPHIVSIKILDSNLDKLYQKIRGHSVIQKLMEDGLVQEINTSYKESICDPIWPLHVRKSWHHFAAGMSNMLLDQISSLRNGVPTHKNWRKIYQKINMELSDDFEKWASHYICHLSSALYGFSKMSFKV